MSDKKNGLSALPLGGVGECGSLNLMVYECDGEMIAVDMGIGFPNEWTPGIDLIVPDITYLRENLDRLKAIVITHAHEDHIGAVHYLWEDLQVPVYLTKFSRLVLEDKLREIGLYGAVPIKEVDVGAKVKVGKFDLEFVPVNHSVPESHGLMIRTRHGNIFHTGDYKFDASSPKGCEADPENLKRIGDEGVLAMFGDSTSVMQTGHSGDEQTVRDTLDKIVAGCKGRVYFTTISSQIARLGSAMEAAVKHGRKIAVMGMSVKKRVADAQTCDYIQAHLSQHIVDIDEALALPHKKAFIVLAGCQGQTRSGMGRLSSGQMHKFSIGKGDTVIHSARWIPGNEAPIAKMVSGLEEQGARVWHMYNERGIYASGHPYRDDVTEMYGLIRPQMAIPVHGDHQQMRAHAELAKELKVKEVFRIADGKKIHLAPGKAKVLDEEFPVGRCYVDGYNILDADRFILKERRLVMEGGLATVTLVLDGETGDITTGPFVKTRGLIDETLQPDLIEMAVGAAQSALAGCFKGGPIDDIAKAEDVMRVAVRRIFAQERGRKPLTVAQVVEV